ncbi:hypothetical protein CRUP_020195 [Coryphaenoides rupestris]|nr:hypothetical protein CRUP_020195 [Coryphaenoides rupestris]
MYLTAIARHRRNQSQHSVAGAAAGTTSISRHRRNQSQHSVAGAAAGTTSLDLQGEYLNKAKISEGGKKQRKNWTSTWVVLGADQLTFYKESKQEALANLV